MDQFPFFFLLFLLRIFFDKDENDLICKGLFFFEYEIRLQGRRMVSVLRSRIRLTDRCHSEG